MSRLEEIKEEYKGFIEMENDENYEESLEIAMWLVDGHLHWLIKQTERVQKLEEKHKEYLSFTESNNYNMDIEFEKLYKQNKRYKQALEEIAYADWDMSHYEYSSLVSRISHQTLKGDKP